MCNKRRARLPYTPARGRCTSDLIPHADRVRLYQSLCADPHLVLGLLRDSNIGFLSELGEGWKQFRQEHPDDAQRVVEIAARMGIAEKPEKRR